MKALAPRIRSALRSRGLALDANLAILLLIGTCRRQDVGKHRRLQTFTPEDVDLLTRLCASARRLETTPHVLTEISDLLGDVGRGRNAPELIAFKRYCQVWNEFWKAARHLAEMPTFEALGLADSGLIALAKNGCAVATIDWQLANRLDHERLPVINFNYLRDL